VTRRGGVPFLAGLLAALTVVALPAFGAASIAGALGAGPQLTATPTSIGFGSLSLGDVSNPTVITLKNTGATTDTISDFAFGGADPNDFVNTSSCGQLVVGASCQLDVSFLPGALGTRQATITPVDNSKSPPVITLQGIGTEGYLETTAEGAVRGFGDAQLFGDTSQSKLKAPVVSITSTGDNGGYWLIATDGGVFTFGDAPYYGSTGGLVLNKPMVGMAQTADGGGYWLVASDGGIFAFGDAQYYGSTGSIHLNKPIVGMTPTLSGDGYWLVASDGGIFAFGDAQYFGSTGGTVLNKPIVGMAATPDGGGYWLVASDGAQQAHCRHGGHTRRRGLLAGRF